MQFPAPRIAAIVTALVISAVSFPRALAAQKLEAGTSIIDITPTQLPAIVNGGFREKTSDTIRDRLQAHCLVLSDGNERIAIVVADSCMMPRDLLDQAKSLASKATGIRTDRMLISATHTHSAVSAMGALGSSADRDYIKLLPGLLARAIQDANANLKPAQAGWTAVDAPDHTHCRRWILRPDKMRTDPFGETTVRATMHPGHQNPDFIGPASPVDTGLSILSVQTAEGKPLAILANYSMHYYGTAPISADYFGHFRNELADRLGADRESGFVAMMSQGTSGDLQWMDYSRPKPARDIEKYAAELADLAHEACQTIQHHREVPLAMAEAKLLLRRRVADKERLAKSRRITEALAGRNPKTHQEIYAREQVFIADDSDRELILQAVRIGDLGITAIPDEVYSITGLKLKAMSPLPSTFNIELANGSEGYIPPPEQHRLGGYTTWEARTASLETNAEPKIVEKLLSLLETVAAKPRRPFAESHGPYAKEVLEAGPLAWWRLGELAGATAHDSSGNGHHARLEHGFALHLEGAPGEGFCQPGTLNRAVHFAGGTLKAGLSELAPEHSIEFWFWNGLAHRIRPTTGVLFTGNGMTLALESLEAPDASRLTLNLPGRRLVSIEGKNPITARTWHHVAVTAQDGKIQLWLDGVKQGQANIPSITPDGGREATLQFAGGPNDATHLEGRIDEAAVYNRALSAAEIKRHYELSGHSQWLAAQKAKAERKAREQLSKLAAPKLDPGYVKSMAATRPFLFWRMDEFVDGKAADNGSAKRAGTVQGNVATAAGATPSPAADNLCAVFTSGRITTRLAALPMNYSVGLWFLNELDNSSRPVTAYLFSRGPDGDRDCPGDHLGIGGSHRKDLTGRIMMFNGNRLNQAIAGKTVIAPNTWNHVLMVRDGKRVRVHLNGNPKPEIDAELPPSITASETQIYFGGRNDNFANLQGRLDEAAVYDRALGPESAVRLYRAAGIEAPLAAAPAPMPQRDSDPLAVAEALKSIQVRPGGRVELVAAEPLVKDPVAIDWGPDGKLWVAEMADYPEGMDGKGSPGGRVRFLEDTNGDGTYDRSTVFLDRLNFPIGVMAWKKGLLITAAPEILYAEDTNGDGRADTTRTLFTGFHEGNQQLRVNGLRWGLDNWVYCASGSHRAGYGGKVRIRSHNGTVYDIGSRDFRILPDSGELVPLSGPSQFGRDRDDWGHWFGEQNSYPIWHYVIQDHYLQRNPDVAFPSPKNILTPRNPRIYPAKSPQKRFHSFDQSGRYTSACSATIYRDELLFGSGEATHGFTCEPFHNLVQHHVLHDSGVSFEYSRDPVEQGLDFFTSTDRWCRPVQVRTGPDGAVWVVDMYRYMIEHPQWLPPHGREELRPFYRDGEDHGRIYRVVPEGKPERKWTPPATQPTGALVAMLEHPNGIVRDLAQRQLIERRDKSATAPLMQLATGGSSAPGRLHALATLHGLDALDSTVVQRALGDKHPGVRRHAVRLLESLSEEQLQPLAEAVQPLTRDPSDKVRLQLALTLGELPAKSFGETLAEMARHPGDDPHLRAGILSSAPAHHETLTRAILESDGIDNPLFANLLAMGISHPDTLPPLLAPLTQTSAGEYSARKFSILAEWLQSLSRRSLSLAGLAERHPSLERTVTDVKSAIDAARKAAGPAPAPQDVRIAAISLLGRQQEDRNADLEILTSLLDPKHGTPVQTAAVSTLARQWTHGAVQPLVQRWPSLLPAVRQTIVNELAAQPKATRALLTAIEDGAIPVSDLNASQRQQFLKHGSKAIRQRAAKVFDVAPGGHREEVVKKFEPALELQGNASHGQELFTRLCAACHQPQSGEAVGPDLRSITDKSPRGLLTAILDPNQSSDPSYLGYNVELNDETSWFGRIVSESGASLTVRTADGRDQVLLRQQIASVRSSRLSLMPEGLEAGLRPQDLADLIAYVRTGALE